MTRNTELQESHRTEVSPGERFGWCPGEAHTDAQARPLLHPRRCAVELYFKGYAAELPRYSFLKPSSPPQ